MLNLFLLIILGCLGFAIGELVIAAIESKRNNRRSFVQVLSLVVLRARLLHFAYYLCGM